MEQTRVPRNNPIIIQKLYNKKKSRIIKKRRKRQYFNNWEKNNYGMGEN